MGGATLFLAPRKPGVYQSIPEGPRHLDLPAHLHLRDVEVFDMATLAVMRPISQRNQQRHPPGAVLCAEAMRRPGPGIGSGATRPANLGCALGS